MDAFFCVVNALGREVGGRPWGRGRRTVELLGRLAALSVGFRELCRLTSAGEREEGEQVRKREEVNCRTTYV